MDALRFFTSQLNNPGVTLTAFERQFLARQIIEGTRALRIAQRTGSLYRGTF